MSDQPSRERPRQVTMASVMAIVGSALLVLTLVDSIGNLRGSDMRDTVEDFLAEPPGNGLGLETAQVLDALHVLGLVAGALAAAAFVLAVFALQGHRGARVGLAITTFLLILTMPVSGLMPVLLAVAVSLLWSRPARDWFDGVVPAAGQLPSEHDPRPGQGGPSAHPGSGAQPPQPSQPSQPPLPPYPGGGGQQGWQPKPASGWQPKPAAGWSPVSPPPYGTGYGQPGPQERPGQPDQPDPAPYAGPAYAPGWTGPEPGGHRDPDKRPGTVTAACVLTWIGAGLVAVVMFLAALVLATSPADFTRELREGMAESEFVLTDDEVLTAGWAIVLTLLVWSLISLVLAVLTFRRSTVARIILVVSAAMTVLVSLLGILSLISVVPLLMAGATVVLLFVGGANDWFARRRPGGASGYDPYGQDYGQYPPSSQYPPSGQYPPPGQYPPYGQHPTQGYLDPYSPPYGYAPQFDPRYDPQYPPPYGYAQQPGQQPGQQEWQQPQPPQQDWHRDASGPTEPVPVSEGSSRDTQGPQGTTDPVGGEDHGREDSGPAPGPDEPEKQDEPPSYPSSSPPPGPPQEQQPRQPRRPW